MVNSFDNNEPNQIVTIEGKHIIMNKELVAKYHKLVHPVDSDHIKILIKLFDYGKNDDEEISHRIKFYMKDKVRCKLNPPVDEK